MKGIWTIVVGGLLIHSSFAGTLDDFEKDTKKSSSAHAHKTTASTASNSEEMQQGFLNAFMTILLFTSHKEGSQNNAEGLDSPDSDYEKEKPLFFHNVGDQTLPYLRADYNWQYIDSDLYAQDIQLEVGYKMLGFLGRHTVYSESNPNDQTSLDQYYAMLRFGQSNIKRGPYGLEIALGLGGIVFKGNSEDTSGALTIPIKFYPTQWIGFEFRPAWYFINEKTIGDYDLSASVGYRFVHLRGGYRWLYMQSEGSHLNGPYLGLSISF